MLTISGVFAGYGGGDVLQGLDLEVPTGAITCIVGPNGAGKSTVLRVVSGLLEPRLGPSTSTAPGWTSSAAPASWPRASPRCRSRRRCSRR